MCACMDVGSVGLSVRSVFYLLDVVGASDVWGRCTTR